MFLEYTDAKIQVVLHCFFHGVTLQHIRIIIFQKKISLYAVRGRGDPVSRSISESVAMALIKQYPEKKLDHIDHKQSCWVQSLFRRMGFVRRLATTGKVPIPDSLKKELEMSMASSKKRR